MSEEYVSEKVHKAEIETVLVAVDGTKDLIDATNKRIDDLQNTVSRQFTILGVIIAVIQIIFAVIIFFLSSPVKG